MQPWLLMGSLQKPLPATDPGQGMWLPLTFLPHLARQSRGATSLRGGWWGCVEEGVSELGLVQTNQTGV